ncbi:hypothetical protein QTO34_003099 [Cnephaeus nilssonii]|uniref:Integrase catalytic domain-containing protein n=1 Tax=Cnephaeus nilssonii TaxID=3371016 RepID=A0AA40LCT6_CNENI|nr:hypothetical protein QTO34_003099 [Eptesicus nilssonii]
MPPHKKTKYLLTMVDTLTGWVEAFPTRKETAEVVAEILITHIIPRFGLPNSIQSDNGPAFISRVVQQVSTSLGISWKLHIPYRPQSSALGNLHPPTPAYVWRFKVHETYDQDSTQVTRQVGSQDCPLVGCQAEILIAVDLRSVSNGGRPYACFAYDQRNPDRCNRDVNTYGGCRWSGCVIHDAYNEVRSGPFFWKDGTFNIRVRDPWDQRWVAGVMGKLYGGGWSSTPSGTIYISREYVMAQEAQIQVSKSILQAEHSLKGKLPDSPRVEVLSSWLQLIQHTLLFLNETRTLPNVSHCFLCVSLQRPLLAAVPLMSPPGTQGHGECQPPLTGIPLWEPETPEPTLPPRICYQTSNPVTVGRVTWNCTQNHTAASPTKASPGTFFWCNGTLSNCINSSDPGPCFGVTVVPQLTLYGESELAWLLPPSHPRARRAAFLPVMLGDFNDRLQIALESTTTTSLASLQRQVTSVAQIALQNRRALDLLTAERGGTCMFLQEECCYYINESGVVEQNVQTLTKLSEELRARHSQDNSLFGWLQSPLATWILPLVGPLILICVFFSLAPCLLKFIRSRIAEMSRVTVNQLLLHPYTRLPLNPPLPDPGL